MKTTAYHEDSLVANLENTQRACDGRRFERSKRNKQRDIQHVAMTAKLEAIVFIISVAIVIFVAVIAESAQYNAKIDEIHSMPTTTITVKQGDTLESISASLDIDGISPTYLADAIRAMNVEKMRESGLIYPGDKLIVPVANAVDATV